MKLQNCAATVKVRKLATSTIYHFPEQEKMLKECVQSFINEVCINPQTQNIEEVASLIHETKRHIDPYGWLVNGEYLLTPNGDRVEDFIERESYLGKAEHWAFQKIQSWASQNETGTCVWFSPPFEGTDYISKIIISEILHIEDGQKILFNRAIVLDIDGSLLMENANKLSDDYQFKEVEVLRIVPVFPKEEEYREWLDKLSIITPQVGQMKSGEDIIIKRNTYGELIAQAEEEGVQGAAYAKIYSLAEERDLFGQFAGSCPPRTAFETMLGDSQIIKKTLKCKCPFCNEQVTAIISGGRIHCTNESCRESVPYKC